MTRTENESYMMVLQRAYSNNTPGCGKVQFTLFFRNTSKLMQGSKIMNCDIKNDMRKVVLRTKVR